MKRLTALLLVLCLLLCACAKKTDTAESTENTDPAATADSQKNTKSTQPEESVSEETEPKIIRHPLTGEVLDDPWFGVVTAVMINNIQAAMPQCGISYAMFSANWRWRAELPAAWLCLLTDLK